MIRREEVTIGMYMSTLLKELFKMIEMVKMDIKDRYAKLRRDLNKKIKAEIEKLTD